MIKAFGEYSYQGRFIFTESSSKTEKRLESLKM